MKITRRRAVAGASVVAAGALAGLEYASFTGRFDHRGRKLPS